MKMQGETTRRVWVARNNTEYWDKGARPAQEQDYVVGPSRPRRYNDGGGVYWDSESCRWMCSSAFHRASPLRLKPGEGPVRVELSWKVVRDE